MCIFFFISVFRIFTRIGVSVGREHHAQTGLVVDRVARVVGVASLQTVGQHQRARYTVQQVVGRGEHVPGDQFEPRHVRVAVFQRRGRRHRRQRRHRHDARVQRARAGIA